MHRVLKADPVSQAMADERPFVSEVRWTRNCIRPDNFLGHEVKPMPVDHGVDVEAAFGPTVICPVDCITLRQ